MTINLRELRLNRGLGITDAAEQMGINRRTLDRVERDQTARPHASTAYKIATFYGYRVTDVWPLEEPTAGAAA